MAVSYIVQQGPSATGPWTAVTGSPFSSPNCTISGETPGTSYFIQITAQDTVLGISSTPAVFGPYTTLGSTGNAPAPAAAVGYNVQTFGPAMSFATDPTQPLGGANWAPFNFFGTAWNGSPGVPPITVTQNANGSLTMSTGNMGDGFGGQLCTAVYDPTQTGYFRGSAFGGGAFFEATLSFTGTPNITGVSFWSNDIESMAGGSFGVAGLTLRQWPGQAVGYGDWIELDFPEFDTGSTTQYGQGIHNWYGTVASTQDVNTGSYPSFVSPITVPTGTDFSQPHKYGFLWVPATGAAASPTNVFGNSALSGAVAGSPGTLWTGADATSQAGGLAFQVVSTGTDGTTGFPFVNLRMHGTATGSDCNIYLAGFGANVTATLPSTTYTLSVGLAVIANLFPANIAGISITSNDLNSSKGYIQGATFQGVTLTGTVQTFTTGFTSTATTAFNTFGIDIGGPTAGQQIDITLRIENPQVLQAPAQGSSGQGFAKWFFDDTQVGTTVFWNKYDTTQPPPPIQGTTAYSVMDTRHFSLILGLGSTSNPVTISAVSVWQASAANNIVNNPGGSLESPAGTTVTTVGPSINASPTPGSPGNGNLLTITAGAQIALNGTTLGGANVIELYYTGASPGANGATSHSAYQENASLNWYGPITASSTGTQISGSPIPAGPTISISTIGTQNTNTPFTVSGTLTGYTSAPTLQTADNAGAFGALPASNTVTATTFSFTHPAVTTANTSFTVSVRDANNISVTATSNTFAINAVVVGAPGVPTALASPNQTASTITVTFALPTTGGTLDHGLIQTLFKTVTAGSYTNGPSIPYITPGSGSFTDSTGVVWTISAAGVIARNATPDTSTSNVTMVMLLPGTPQVAWQVNTALNWYSQNIPAVAFGWNGGNPISPLTSQGVTLTGLANPQSYNIEVEVSDSIGQGNPCSPITAATQTINIPSGQFSIVNGKVIAPGGATWICRGVANYFNFNTGSGTVSDHATISGPFFGINTFKACIAGGNNPTFSSSSAMITDWTTNHNCVIIIANYLYGAQVPINSGNFAQDASVFANLAVGTIGNEYVWFESENEPSSGGNASYDQEHVNHYNAIRQLVNFTGTSSGNNLTISNISSPSWNPGASIIIGMTINPLSGSGAVPLHTTIVSQTSGTTGGAGVYVTSNATTVSGTSLTAGNGNIVVFCSPGGNPFFPNNQPSNFMSGSTYTNMYNIIWDDHMYGTGNGTASTGPNDTLNSVGNTVTGWIENNSLPVRIGGFNALGNSLDGQVPVGSFEWGDAYGGSTKTNFGTTGGGQYENQVIACLKAVCNAGVGNGIAGWCGQTAWLYGNYRPGNTSFYDTLTDGNNNIISGALQTDNYGPIIAFSIANPNTKNTGTYGHAGGPS